MRPEGAHKPNRVEFAAESRGVSFVTPVLPRKDLLVADDTPLDSGLRRNDASQHLGRFLYKVALTSRF